MKRTVDIKHNVEIIKELESLSGCTLSYKAVGCRNGYKVSLETLDKPQFENPFMDIIDSIRLSRNFQLPVRLLELTAKHLHFVWMD